MNAIVQAAAPAIRFVKVSATGQPLPADAPAWDAVLDTRSGLMWALKAEPVKNGRPATVNKAAERCRAGGFTDWRAPTVDELFPLADRTRVRPAIDTDFFPDTPSDWFWTITPYAGSPSGCAWYVHFYGGLAYWSNHNYDGFVRAVRAGQLSDIGAQEAA